MLNRKISFGMSWTLIGVGAIGCFYLAQLLMITNDNLVYADFEGELALTAPHHTQNDTYNNTINTQSKNMVTLKTNKGDITLELFADKAPKAVENFKKLASSGFYNGVKFHRVIKGFMIQAGDPLSKDPAQINRWGTGGPGYQFADELTGKETYPQGTLAMANAGPNTNGSQFFIVTASPAAQLAPNYTVFGKVVSGLDVALAIEKVATYMPGRVDRPLEDVVIQSVVVQ